MPELPDIELYRHALTTRLVGHRLERVRLASPFLLRTVEPPLAALHEQPLLDVRRIGKRLCFVFPDSLYLVIHLMIAGRLRYEAKGAKVPGKVGLGALDFDCGSVILTEASSKKRASMHVVRGEAALAEHDRGGLEVLDATPSQFVAAMRRENRTLKRALTDPSILSGIGNAYSDEILHGARLSPTTQTRSMDDAALVQLHAVVSDVLTRWTERLRTEFEGRFPGAGDVTAFRDDFAVHGRYGKPCPVCGSPVQRIRYADNESNYCASCQTGGKLLADRGLSRLLGKDWPKTLDELEARRGG